MFLDLKDLSEVVQCVLVDDAQRVVDQRAAEVKYKQKKLAVVREILVGRADTLTIHNDVIEGIALLVFGRNRFAPQPESLGLSVHSIAYLEGFGSSEEQLVKEIGLSGAVCTGN